MLTMKAAFIGLGQMGKPIATNLIRAGHQLVVYNRTKNKAQGMTQMGATVVDSPAQAVRNVAVVITMLADDHALEAVAFGPEGLVGSLPSGGIHLSLSTISVALARRLTADHQKHGQHFVS